MIDLFVMYKSRFEFCSRQVSKVSSNPGKVNFMGLVYTFIYIKDDWTLGLKYYADIKDAPLSDLLRQANIKTENQLADFSESSW